MQNQKENKICQNCKNSFVIEPEDFEFYDKIKVPPPTFCPECRNMRRMLFRNFKTLYKRPSDKSGKMIVSMYNPEAKFPVYETEEWWGDDWDPMDYKMDVDFNRPFFNQIRDLFNRVPHQSLMQTKCTDCEYANMAYGSKNCYFIFGCVDDEDCNYGHIVWNSSECVDNLYIFKCESCYECIDCQGSAKLFYSQECESCVDSIGLYDCRNCLNCIGCVGQISKSYCIFNKQVTKEEYKEFLLKYPLNEKSSIDYILAERDNLRKDFPHRSFFGTHNDNVTGNHIYNSHNIHDSFDIKGGEDSKYCFTARVTVDTYDASFCGADIYESYQVLTCLGNKIFGSELAVDSHDILYSSNCYGCNDLFGCYGLRKKSYCILNKQYTKEEYESLKEKIVELMEKSGEWGDFFPINMSPFAYNESIANEYMPISKEDAIAKGFEWKDNIPATRGQGTIDMESLPNNPSEYSDELTGEIFTCTNCEKNYKIISQEVNFYRKNKLALPTTCFNCRHEARISKRLTRKLNDLSCANCQIPIKTAYTKEQSLKYKIYCESCYNKEIY